MVDLNGPIKLFHGNPDFYACQVYAPCGRQGYRKMDLGDVIAWIHSEVDRLATIR